MLVAMSRHETQDECMHLETKADLASKKRRIRIKRPVSYTYIYIYIYIYTYTPYVRADKPKARLPQMARGTIFLARTVHCSPISFFISLARPASLYCVEHIYIYTYLTAWRMCMNYRCYQTIMRVKHFYTS